MRIWDSMCATLLSTGARRGAMMATLPCDHPDIEEFVSAKQDNRELRHFNMSVQVTDDLWRRYAAMVSGSWCFPLQSSGTMQEMPHQFSVACYAAYAHTPFGTNLCVRHTTTRRRRDVVAWIPSTSN